MPALASTSKQKSSVKKQISNSTQMSKSFSVINQPRKHENLNEASHSNHVMNKNLLLNKKVYVNKCPHVILIGNLTLQDLDVKSLIAYQQEKRKKLAYDSSQASTSSNLVKYESQQQDEDQLVDQHLKCDECDKRKNLWLCLRDDCRFIGCGQDSNSNKHSNLHSLKTFHPLSINLSTRFVWCDLCKEKINLESNNPSFSFGLIQNFQVEEHSFEKSKYSKVTSKAMTKNGEKNPFSSLKETDNELIDYSNLITDDFDLISYLDQENINLTEENEHDEYAFNKNTRLMRNGLLGLDNLGNTCYMSAALQALSNCYAFSSYFLECSEYVSFLSNLKSIQKNSDMSVASNYMKLMKELWQEKMYNTNKSGAVIGTFQSFTPSEMVHAIKLNNPMFRGYMQHDSQELLIYLMDQLHEELKRPNNILKRKVLTHKNKSKEQSNQHDECMNNETQENDIPMSPHYENEEDEDDDDITVVQNQRKTLSKNFNNSSDLENGKMKTFDLDSGISSISNKSSANNGHIHLNGNSCSNSGDESIDSFETCGEDADTCLATTASSDLSEKLHFSDADETLPPPVRPFCETNNSSDKNSLQECKINKKAAKSDQKSENSLPKLEDLTYEKTEYSSIVSELFDGKLISQVQCLECNHFSTTTETFQHLSLPIPSKEYLQSLHNKILNSKNKQSSNLDDEDDDSPGESQQGWLSWMADIIKGYLWNTTIKLTECLTAFFSDDDLKGDNMYSCEKCKKLTNGIKYSKILNLPETLIIHLKRFRHDQMFSTGKINSYVEFPLDNLNMQPFVHRKCRNEITQYDLCSIICHHGGANGGHYTSFARNCFNEEWYEYDDSYCRQVESLSVQNAQAYVLFFKKKNIKTDGIKEHLRSIFVKKSTSNAITPLIQRPYYISKQWLHKLKYFGEPGPIDNSDFLCRHNFVQPNLWKIIDDLAIACSVESWDCLVQNFGLKVYEEMNDESIGHDKFNEDSFMNSSANSFSNVCNYLFPCKTCQLENEALKQRQLYEKSEFLDLKNKWEQHKSTQFQSYQTLGSLAGNFHYKPMKMYAISGSWYKEWEHFVQIPTCPLKNQIPSKINNFSICIQQKSQQTVEDAAKENEMVYQLNKNSNYYKISEDMWNFLFKIYGGGPILPIINVQSQNQTSSSIKSTPLYTKTRTTSLSQTQSTTSTSNTDNSTFPSRQISNPSTSSSVSMQCSSLTSPSQPPQKLNNSISDSSLNKNIKKLAADSKKFNKPSTNSNNHSNINSGLILKIPNI